MEPPGEAATEAGATVTVVHDDVVRTTPLIRTADPIIAALRILMGNPFHWCHEQDGE
jgi:peptide subunit release factor 1 (eRF1)